ncbi:MAG TPA: glycosyltransferase family 2 protein [Isosphaeraceae bacterium]|nr:glycosyltransferase family 2 protein [Isosphaeraceae bacterium]
MNDFSRDPFRIGSPAVAEAGSMADDPELSVVIPCYNEEEVLPELHRRVTAACGDLTRSYELVLVNDGSRDRTWPVLAGLAADDPHIVAVNLSRNHGHQLALTAGLSLCRGERILILDADLQDPPELLVEMFRVMDQERADVVYGQRRSRAGETALKLATASLFYRLIERLADVSIPRDTGDFRLMTRRALNVLLAMPERHRFTRGMVSWIGFRQVPILYDRQPRLLGTTKYPLRKMVRFALDAITAFSIKPLVLASLGGVATALLALALGAYSIAAYIRGSTVVGWTSLMAVVTFLSSVQLLVLGVIGEYLGRMYEQIKGRPLFIIDQVIRSDRGDGLGHPEFRAGTPLATRGGMGRAVAPTRLID